MVASILEGTPALLLMSAPEELPLALLPPLPPLPLWRLLCRWCCRALVVLRTALRFASVRVAAASTRDDDDDDDDEPSPSSRRTAAEEEKRKRPQEVVHRLERRMICAGFRKSKREQTSQAPRTNLMNPAELARDCKGNDGSKAGRSLVSLLDLSNNNGRHPTVWIVRSNDHFCR